MSDEQSPTRSRPTERTRAALPQADTLELTRLANTIHASSEKIAFESLDEALALVPLDVRVTESEQLANKIRTVIAQATRHRDAHEESQHHEDGPLITDPTDEKQRLELFWFARNNAKHGLPPALRTLEQWSHLLVLSGGSYDPPEDGAERILGHYSPEEGIIYIEADQHPMKAWECLLHEILHHVDERIVSEGVTTSTVPHAWIYRAAELLFELLACNDMLGPVDEADARRWLSEQRRAARDEKGSAS